MSADPRQGRLAAAALLLGLAVACSTGDDGAAPASTATPGTPISDAAAHSPAATPSQPSPASPESAPAPHETVAPSTAGTRAPTDADVEAFVAAEGPADRTATGDVDGDGAVDVAIARTRDQTTRLVVGFWDGSAFRTDADEGGPARVVDDVTIGDLNGVGGAEVVARQSVGEAGASISVWSGDNGRLVRQEAKGGCWDGFHTYGISGATIEPGRITATCDGSPLPPESWMSDVYEWSEGAWTYTETISAEQE